MEIIHFCWPTVIYLLVALLGPAYGIPGEIINNERSDDILEMKSLISSLISTVDKLWNDSKEKTNHISVLEQRLLKDSTHNVQIQKELEKLILEESKTKDMRIQDLEKKLITITKENAIKTLNLQNRIVYLENQHSGRIPDTDEAHKTRNKRQNRTTANGVLTSDRGNNENLQNAMIGLERIGRIEKEVLSNRHNIHKRVAESLPGIAFHATLDTALVPHLDTIIVFRHEHLDTANAYDETLGLFIAPVDGIYVFTSTLSIGPHSWATASLMINGNKSGETLADSEEINDYHTSTGIVVSSLKKDARVHVEFKTTANKGVLDSVYGINSFSGWKLD